MAYRFREEIVGKRFLSVKSSTKLKINRICDWDWRAGIVRAVSQKDYTDPEVAVSIDSSLIFKSGDLIYDDKPRLLGIIILPRFLSVWNLTRLRRPAQNDMI